MIANMVEFFKKTSVFKMKHVFDFVHDVSKTNTQRNPKK